MPMTLRDYNKEYADPKRVAAGEKAGRTRRINDAKKLAAFKKETTEEADARLTAGHAIATAKIAADIHKAGNHADGCPEICPLRDTNA
jgi:molybdenum cofactor biosynthesis enzyme